MRICSFVVMGTIRVEFVSHQEIEKGSMCTFIMLGIIRANV